MPQWIPLGNVFSIGDVVIGIGTLVVVAMRTPRGLADGGPALHPAHPLPEAGPSGTGAA